MPLIWGVLLPLLVLDAAVELYHRLCFPLYGLPYVSRSRYIRVWDRFRLPYITIWDRLGCAYCGYANGWVRYAQAIAAATEAYWCGIRHRPDPSYQPAEHEERFVPYDDKSAYQQRYLPPRSTR